MKIPLTVPPEYQKQYQKNFMQLTHEDPRQRCFIFAADQRLEHLYDDFHGDQIPEVVGEPEHIFQIAQDAPISALATHFGLISRYGLDFPTIPYIVKMNGKSNLIDPKQQDPYSSLLFSFEAVLQAGSSINLVGLGYTIYLGSRYESTMLHEAALVVAAAHSKGLIAILWIYPRGNHLLTQKNQSLSAGATGTALSLGADFVKIAAPPSLNELKDAVKNGGNTGVICAGGATQESKQLLTNIKQQLEAGARGCAIGRNIFQKNRSDAIALCTKIHALLYS